MKMAFQTILWIVMLFALFFWAANSTNMKLHNNSAAIDHNSPSYRYDWIKACNELELQTITHADEVFWICLVAWILTLKVRT